MNFKYYLCLYEALSPEVQAVLEKSKFPVTQDLVAQAIKDLNSDLDKEGKVISDKATAFKLLRQKLGLEKKPEVPEPTEEILKPFYKQLTNKEITLPIYKTAEYFKNNTPAKLQVAIQELKQIIADRKAELLFTDKPQLVFRGENFDKFDDIDDFSTKLHAIEAASNKPATGFDEFRDPIAADLKHSGTMLWPPKGAKSNPSKIYIFKGDSFLKCKYFGKGAPWCVTKNPSHYYDYRSRKKQSQFFVIDYNKAPDDPARYTNPGISDNPYKSEFVDLENDPRHTDQYGTDFGINGHTSSREYMDYLQKMGVPDPWELMKPDPVSKEEEEFAERMSDPKFFTWAKSLGKQKFIEWLQTLGASGEHLEKHDFNTLTDDEKYNYIVETGMRPKNMDEANYLKSLSRKDYKEYLANFSEYEKKLGEFLLQIKSGQEPTDAMLKFYGRNLQDGMNHVNYDFIGAQPEKPIDLPLIYLQYLDRVKPYDGNKFGAYQTIITDLLSNQKTPIKAYNYFMSNLDQFKKLDDDFFVNTVANDYLPIKKDKDLVNNYYNLIRMFYKKLDDNAKVRTLQKLQLTGDDDKGFNERAVERAKVFIKNIDELKKIYGLIGKKEWMNVMPVFENLSKEDHDWVVEHLGNKPFVQPSSYTQEIARKHFKVADRIDSRILSHYLHTAGLEKTIEFINDNKLWEKMLADDTNPIASILMHAFKVPTTYLRNTGKIDPSVNEESVFKLIPKNILYHPKVLLNFIAHPDISNYLYEYDREGKKGEPLRGLEAIKKYLSHADKSVYDNLAKGIAEDGDVQEIIYNRPRLYNKLLQAKEDLPELVRTLWSSLPEETDKKTWPQPVNLYTTILSHINSSYLDEIITPEWIKGQGKNVIDNLFLNIAHRLASSNAKDSYLNFKLIKRILDHAQPYEANIMLSLLGSLSLTKFPLDDAMDIMTKYVEKMPMNKVKELLAMIFAQQYANRFSIYEGSPIAKLMKKKMENMPFETFNDIYSIKSSGINNLLKLYLRLHPLTDEQLETLFNHNLDDRSAFLNIRGHELLAINYPEKFNKLVNKVAETKPDIDPKILEKLKEIAQQELKSKQKSDE